METILDGAASASDAPPTPSAAGHGAPPPPAPPPPPPAPAGAVVSPPLGAAVPGPLVAAVAGTTAVVGALLWDISWHASIGRDTFWTPAHPAIYLVGLLCGLSAGWAALAPTFA